MVTSEERLKILKMVEDGKISAEAAVELLEALGGDRPVPESGEPPDSPPPGHSPRWCRVMVTDTNTGRVRVNVRLPVNLVQAGMKMGARFAPEVQGLDSDQLMAFIRAGETGKVVDVFDDDDGEHVEVYLE